MIEKEAAMEYSLDLDSLPSYMFSSYRYFDEHEKHVTRYCEQDVLILMLGGVLRFREDGCDIELGGGEYYIQRRGLYQEGVRESELAQYYYIHFCGNFTESAHSLPIRGSADTASLVPYFNELDRLRFAAPRGGATAVETNAVFYTILSKLAEKPAPSEHSALVHRAVSAVTRDLSRPITLRELSRECGYCENHLINVFRRQTGKTPHAYITALRLDRACRLLEDSEMSAARVAEECGFGDYVNLYKHFVREKGISPAKWRSIRRGR